MTKLQGRCNNELKKEKQKATPQKTGTKILSLADLAKVLGTSRATAVKGLARKLHFFTAIFRVSPAALAPAGELINDAAIVVCFEQV